MKSFPFDSKILQGKDGDTQYDRAIDSKTLREYFHLLYSNGVFAGENSECFEVVLDETSVTSTDKKTSDSSFRVIVKPGACNIEGALGIEEKETVITIDPNENLSFERQDSIVLRLDTSIEARKISIEYKKGTKVKEVVDENTGDTIVDVDTSRAKLIRNSTIYELRVAVISVPIDTKLSDLKHTAFIWDTRWLTPDCGVVLCNPKQIDTSGISDQLNRIQRNALADFDSQLAANEELAKNQLLSSADDIRNLLLDKDEAGKITLELAEYVKGLQESVTKSDELEERIEKLKNSSEALQKTTLPTINNNIDRLKKTVNEDIQNTLHSNGTSINSLGDRIGTLVSRVSTLEDKIKKGFFFNKKLNILELAVSTGTAFADEGLTIVIKKDGYTRDVHLMEALEDQWRKSYNHCWILKDRNLEIGFSEVNAGRSLDGTCSIILENKYFRTWEGNEDYNPDFYLRKKQTKGILFATFGFYSSPSMPDLRRQYAVQFYVDGSIYYADYNRKTDTYMWAIPINSSDERINLDFIFDFAKAYDVEGTDYLSVGIKFQFSLKYIYA